MKDIENCYYCGALLQNGNIEYDHFPTPKSCEGFLLIPSCITCHSMKDRFNIGDWPETWLNVVSKEMPYFSRETKIWLAKMISFMERQVYSLNRKDK